MKQSKAVNGDMRPEHKKTTNTTTVDQTTYIDTLQKITSKFYQ